MGVAVTEEQLRFHLEEYKSIRSEIAYTLKLIYDFFIWGTLASGAIAAWLLTNAEQIEALGDVHRRIAWFIPLFVAGLACAGFYHFTQVIRILGDYSKKLEDLLSVPGFGWEAFGQSNPKTHIWAMSRFKYGIAWSVILLGDLALAMFVT